MASAANTVIPAPSAWLESWAESARTIFLSLTVTVVELTIVSVPSTCKSPLIITLPVLSPTAAGSIIKVSGPFIWPVIFKIPISALSINAWPMSAESIIAVLILPKVISAESIIACKISALSI